MSDSELSKTIEVAWEDRESLGASTKGKVRDAVEHVLDGLDRGQLRIAEKFKGEWVVHQWLKKAVLLSFRLNDYSAHLFSPLMEQYLCINV